MFGRKQEPQYSHPQSLCSAQLSFSVSSTQREKENREIQQTQTRANPAVTGGNGNQHCRASIGYCDFTFLTSCHPCKAGTITCSPIRKLKLRGVKWLSQPHRQKWQIWDRSPVCLRGKHDWGHAIISPPWVDLPSPWLPSLFSGHIPVPRLFMSSPLIRDRFPHIFWLGSNYKGNKQTNQAFHILKALCHLGHLSHTGDQANYQTYYSGIRWDSREDSCEQEN